MLILQLSSKLPIVTSKILTDFLFNFVFISEPSRALNSSNFVVSEPRTVAFKSDIFGSKT